MPRTHELHEPSSPLTAAIHGLAVWLGTGGIGLYERLLQNERERLRRRGA